MSSSGTSTTITSSITTTTTTTTTTYISCLKEALPHSTTFLLQHLNALRRSRFPRTLLFAVVLQLFYSCPEENLCLSQTFGIYYNILQMCRAYSRFSHKMQHVLLPESRVQYSLSKKGNKDRRNQKKRQEKKKVKKKEREEGK